MSDSHTSYGMSEDGIRRRTLHGIGWSGAQQAMQQGLQFAFTILLSGCSRRPISARWA